ncbi:hypothetical protein THOM_2268, partial [Trachipleistophora hominis]
VKIYENCYELLKIEEEDIKQKHERLSDNSLNIKYSSVSKNITTIKQIENCNSTPENESDSELVPELSVTDPNGS